MTIVSQGYGSGGGGGGGDLTAIAVAAPLAGTSLTGPVPSLSIPAATAGAAGHATAAQITKLDGIEALADVTDAANVQAAISGDRSGARDAITPASAGEALYQNAGTIDGAERVLIDTGNLALAVESSLAVPAALAGAIKLFAQRPAAGFPARLAARNDLADRPFVEPFFAPIGRHFMALIPGSSTNPTVIGGVAQSPGNGTMSHPTPTDTNEFTRRLRTHMNTAVTANARAVTGIAGTYVSRRTGFDLTISDWDEEVITANMRCMVGLFASVPGGTNAIDAPVNAVYVGHGPAASEWSRYNNDGSGTAASASLGAGFPVLALERYSLRLRCAPAGNIFLELYRHSTDTRVVYEFTSDLPDLAAQLVPLKVMFIGADAATGEGNVCGMYATRPNG